MSPVPSVKIPGGAEFPMVGLGTWKSKQGEVAAAVKHALAKGYRSVDCAAVYGNEAEVGEGLREGMKEAGIKREEVFVTSKLWNTFHHADDVEAACKKTLGDLGLEYLDLYLIHWPTAFKRGEGTLFPKNEDGTVKVLVEAYDKDIGPTETYLAMEKLVKKGLVRAIGVSNFNSEQIADVLEKAEIKPATNQVECHPYFNQAKLLNFMKEKGIVMTAYSPLGSPDRPWAQPDEPVLLEDPRLLEMGKKHGKTPAQVILKWLVQRGVVVIPKSVTPSRIEENFDLFGDFQLSEEEMNTLDSFDKGGPGRIVCPRAADGTFRDKAAPYFPFNIEF